jgi:aminotransferase
MTAIRKAARLANLVQSDIRAMTRACNAAGGINLGQGVCDVPAPRLIKDAAIRAINEDLSIYTRFDGEGVLREAMAAKFASFNGLSYDSETEIVVTIGASGAYAATLMALFDPGDELVIFEPYYGYHLNTALVAGLVPKFVALDAPDFAIDFNKLEAQITPKTRAILVNTPTNPSGKVFTQAELEVIAELARRHDLLVLTDEVYEYIVYGNHRHISPATVADLAERTVTMGSCSKTFSITGWRIGYAAARADLAQAIGLANDLYYVCAPTPLQHAVAHGIRNLTADYYTSMRTDLERMRDQFCEVLTEIGFSPIVPNGAYYVLSDISSLKCETARDAALKLLGESGVAGVPGTSFFRGNAGNHLLRFCYAKSQADLDRACEQLLNWHSRRSA